MHAHALVLLGLLLACSPGGQGATKSAPVQEAPSKPAERPRFQINAEQSPPAIVPVYGPKAKEKRRGSTRLLGKMAPELRVRRWTEGTGPIPSIAAERGRVVVLYAFQGW